MGVAGVVCSLLTEKLILEGGMQRETWVANSSYPRIFLYTPALAFLLTQQSEHWISYVCPVLSRVSETPHLG